MEAGFTSFELGATITGERFYAARGYQPIERIEVPLADRIAAIRARKAADRAAARANAARRASRAPRPGALGGRPA